MSIYADERIRLAVSAMERLHRAAEDLARVRSAHEVRAHLEALAIKFAPTRSETSIQRMREPVA